MDSTRKPISLILNSSTLEDFRLETRHSILGIPNTISRSRRANLTTSERPLATPRTARTARTAHTNALDGLEQPTLISIIESKSMSPKVGICIVDPNTSQLTITEIVDSQTYVRTIHKINIHSQYKVDIIVPVSFTKPNKTNLMKILEQNLSNDAHIQVVSKHLFKCESGGKTLLLDNVNDSDKAFLDNELDQKHFALCSACAALNYIRDSRDNIFVHEKFNVKYEASESTAFIDSNTVKSLELVENKVEIKKGMSLLKFLDSTVTKMGHRLLRNNILQPFTNEPSLHLRYDAAEELIDKEGILLDIVAHLKDIPDLDRLFSFLTKKPKESLDVISDQKINTIIQIKQAMKLCSQLGSDLEFCNSTLLIKVRETVQHPDVSTTLEWIDESINDDCMWATRPAELRNQQCYAIKSGLNGLLDASRQLYNSIIEDILEIADKLGNENGLSIEAKFDTNRGFHLKIKETSKNLINELHEDFINKTRKNKYIDCTTLEIAKLNARMENAYSEILIMSEQTVDELLSKCKKNISTYFMISEATALLDLICCFAGNVLKRSKYVRPEFSSSTTICKGRHPILETLVDHKFVGNDIVSMPETSRVQIITGPNMSGKSVYLSQIPLISILAQIGSFVPANYAKLTIYKSIYARISNDTNKPNLSSFSAEMTEMAFILNNSDTDSLIIIDELGRASSYTDGFSISLACLEYIINAGSTCFMCTHFTDLPKVLQKKQGVLEMYMKSEQQDKSSLKRGSLRMTYELTKGVNWVTGYGISMISSLGVFPEEILKDAEDIGELIKISKKRKFQTGNKDLINIRKRNVILDVYQTLKELAKNRSMKDSELIENLKIIESAAINKLSGLIEEDQDMSADEEDDDDYLLAVQRTTNRTNDTSVHDQSIDHRSDQGNVQLIEEEDFLIEMGLADK